MPVRRRSVEKRRLERGEGPTRQVFEAELSGKKLVTRWGQHGGQLRVAEKVLASATDAQAAFNAALLARMTKGFEEPKGRPASVGLKGVSARNEALEEAIDAEPEGQESYVVYGDWLQSMSDPRGELIAVQLGLARDPDNEALLDAEAALFKKFRGELLGPLEKVATRRLYNSYARAFEWYGGFIRKASLHESRTPLAETLELLLGHPSGRFVQELDLAGMQIEQALATLGAAPRRTLRRLRIAFHGYTTARANLSGAFLSALPRLELWDVGIMNVVFAPGVYPNVRELSLTLHGDAPFASLSKITFPDVRALRYVDWQEGGAKNDGWTEAFAAGMVPALTSLAVKVIRPTAASVSRISSTRAALAARELTLSMFANREALDALAESLPRLSALERFTLETPRPIAADARRAITNVFPSTTFEVEQA